MFLLEIRYNIPVTVLISEVTGIYFRKIGAFGLKRKIFILLSILVFMSGCSSMLNRDFVYSQQHITPSSATTVTITNITDYESLVEAINTMIANCRTKQTFQLSDFSDDIEQDIKNAVQQVLSTPLGVYAVSNILYKTSLILNYYELSFNITYNCTEDDVRGIIPLSGKMDLKMALMEKLPEFRTKILFYANTYQTVCEDIDECIREMYYMNPLYAIGFAGYEYKAYPENAKPCIVELRIRYTEPAVLLTTKIKNTETKILEILEEAKEWETPFETLKFFHDYLSSNVIYDQDTQQQLAQNGSAMERTTQFSIYGALSEGKAVSEGYALALKELCDRYGITCVLVSGTCQGVYHMWNRVYLDGKWYFIDCSADALGDGQVGYGYFCVTDEVMRTYYTWDGMEKAYSKSMEIRDTLEEMGVDAKRMEASRYAQ